MSKCALYRHFDKNDVLLYVGISNSFLARSVAHQSNAHWYEQIATIKVEWCASREAALWAEDVAIRQENPLHNLSREGKKGPKSRSPAIEEQRQAIFAKASNAGIRLDKRSCLGALEDEFRRLTRG